MSADLIELGRLFLRRRLRGAALRRAREARLLALVRHAFENVPFHAERFRAAGLEPGDVRSLDDLPRLPVTTKEELRRAGDAALDRRAGGLRRFVTSGSSGVPLSVALSPGEVRRRELVDFHALLRIGARPWDRIAIMGPAVTRPARGHEVRGLFRTTMIPNELGPEEQARRLAAARPTILWGYPTFLRAIAESADAAGLPLPRPRLLITSAEILDPATERRLAGAFAWRERFELYGAIELGRIATECRAHSGLHVEADRVIVELEPLAETGDLASVIVTVLDADVMPMIRYRIGDVTAPIAGECVCGSAFPRIRPPHGRDWELLRLPSGRLVPPLLLNRSLKDFPSIDRYRVVQTARDRVVVEAAFLAGAPATRCADLRGVVAAALGEPMRVEVVETRFADPPGRKFRPFVVLAEARDAGMAPSSSRRLDP
jgi:phenylacetate-CoA ligase